MAAVASPEKARERAIYKMANTAASQARFPPLFLLVAPSYAICMVQPMPGIFQVARFPQSLPPITASSQFTEPGCDAKLANDGDSKIPVHF